MAKSENILDMRRLWRAMKKLRWIYAASMAGFLLLGCVYWYVALPLYHTQGMMLIEESESGAGIGAGDMGQMMKTFSIGGFGGAAVDNEMLIARSHDVAMRVVRNLKLNRTYTSRLDGDKCVLFNNSPVAVEAPSGYFDTLSVALKVRVQLLDNGKADIKVTKGLLRRTVGEAEGVTLPAVVDTEFGKLQILKTACFDSSPYRDIKVSITGNEIACRSLEKALEIDVASKLGDAILVEYNAPNRELGKAVVNAIMSEYNLKRLGRTHSKAAEEIEYYDGRISELLTQLTDAEQKVADFQSKKGIYGDPEMVSVLFGTSFGTRMSNIEAQNTIAYYEKVLETLNADINYDTLIPTIELGSAKDENVGSYNQAVLYRKELLKSATSDNAALRNLDERMTMLRKLVIENAEKMIAKAKNDLKGRENVAGSASSKLTSLPQDGMKYASLMRDSELKSATYSFLLQCREQAVLQLYSTTSLGFVFEDAHSDLKPDNMMKMIVMLLCVMLGLFCPTCLAVICMFRYKKISDTMDLASFGLEDGTVVYDGSKAQTNKLRSLFLERPESKLIYLAAMSCDGSVISNALAESLMAIDKKVELVPAGDDNDVIISAQWNKEKDAALAAGDYVIVPVPNPDRLYELAHAVDTQECEVLVCVEAGKVKTKYLKSVLHGMPAGKVKICIVK